MENRSTKQPTVLITGAAGLIGSRIVEVLGARYQLVAFDVVAPQDNCGEIDFIRCDLTDNLSVGHALGELRRRQGQELASVIHLAAYYDFSGEPSPLYEELTVEGPRRLLRGFRDFGFQVEQFIFSSSLLVMRPVEQGQVLTEASGTQAEWDYPRSKLETERVIQEERGEIPAVVLRIAGVYDDDCRSIPIAHQIKRIYERDLESYFFPGNAEQGQSFVHLDDLVDCLDRVVDGRRDLAAYEVFLVGEPDVMSYAELQDRIGEALHGHEWPTIRIPKTAAKAGAWLQEKLSGDDEEPFIKPWMVDLADAHYPVDPSKARARLGWAPGHSLRTTLGEVLRRLKEDPRRWYKVNKLPAPEELAR